MPRGLLHHAGQSSHLACSPGSGCVGTRGTEAQRVRKLGHGTGRGSLRACGGGHTSEKVRLHVRRNRAAARPRGTRSTDLGRPPAPQSAHHLRVGKRVAMAPSETIPTEVMRDRLAAGHQRSRPLPQAGWARSPGVLAACLWHPGRPVAAHAGRRRRAAGVSAPVLRCAAGVTSGCESQWG